MNIIPADFYCRADNSKGAFVHVIAIRAESHRTLFLSAKVDDPYQWADSKGFVRKARVE